MIGKPYSVEIRSLSEATCDVVLEIKPAVDFVTEEARKVFGNNVLRLVCRRADSRDDVMSTGIVEVTHNTPNHESSIGYAKIESLRYGGGKEIFTQALLTALNGESDDLYESGKAPWES
ncbi:hypothetical protein EOM57_05650 [Candidatus Saccharibacteria bacterium]|nr:hypothetical protein [Candidatus Saccharibacteria bacterium]